RTNKRVFDHGIIRDLLQRPIYVGSMNNAGVLVKGKHEAIIDPETFERVQREIRRRKERQSPVGEYFLSGLIRCGVCGGPVIHVYAKGGKNKNYTYSYYACKAQHVRRKERNNSCSLGYHPEEKVNKWVSEKIKSIALNTEELEKELERQKKVTENDTEIIEQLEKAYEEVNRKLNRWYAAFEEGIIDPGQLKDRINLLEEEKKKILARLDDYDIEPNDQEEIMESLKTIGEAWELMTIEEQKSIIRAVVDRIILYPDRDPEIIWNV
ncbi:MAG: recombinase zinc beta ribbon domain-containing protein, partial [Thermicanus sp.]|nr:recombinase zinc beta ribbon domain-containing protein [Thermicanus sp.]